jgi:hypothetical protein
MLANAAFASMMRPLVSAMPIPMAALAKIVLNRASLERSAPAISRRTCTSACRIISCSSRIRARIRVR